MAASDLIDLSDLIDDAGRFGDLTGLDAAPRHLPTGDCCAMVLAGHHPGTE